MLTAGRLLRIWLVVLLVGAIVASFYGPFDQLGYDLAVGVALAAGIYLPHLAAQRVADLRHTEKSRRRSPLDYVLALFTQLILAGTMLLAVPLVVFIVRGLWVPHCDLGGGLLWYILLPGVTTIYASALGLFFGLATRRRILALAASYGFILLTVAVALRHVIADPPTFFFNGILGYFPGPIYDEGVEITTAVLWARLGTLVWSMLFLATAAATCDIRRHRLDPVHFLELDYSFENLTPRLLALLCAVGILVLHVVRLENGTSPTAASIQDRLGGRVESDHFTIYYDPDAASRAEVSLFVEDHEFRLAQVLAFLGLDAPPERKKLRSYIYPSPEVKRALMGAGGTSYADPFDRAMHLNQEEFPHPVLKHELAHVISASFAGPLGFNPRLALHEGLAVAADWEEERLTPDQWSAAMKSEGVLPDFRSFASSFAFWAAPASRAYLSSGSFVRHLVREFGPQRFLAFFRDNDAARHFGQPIAALADAWTAGLDTIHVTPADSAFAHARLARGTIFQRRCPRETAKLSRAAWQSYNAGRFTAALRDFERLLRWSPEDTNARLGQLYTLLKLERTKDATAMGRALISDDRAGPQLIESVRDVLGNLAWRSSDRSEAALHYRAITSSGAVDHLVRGAHAKLAVLDDRDFQTIFVDDAGPVETAALLSRLAETGPQTGLAHYLLGRRLYLEGSWESAAAHLETALAAALPGPIPSLASPGAARAVALAGAERARPSDTAPVAALPDTSLHVECLWLLGQAHYRVGDPGPAEAVFQRIADLRRNEAEALRARSWIDRCRWRRGMPISEARYTRTATLGGGLELHRDVH